MASGAAFAQSFMFENETSGLFAVAARALFVQPRHAQSPGRLHDIEAVRIMALHAIHFPFTNRMVLREIELGMNFEMTGEARLRFSLRVHDEFSAPAACRDMLAAGPMARFAAGAADWHHGGLYVNARVRTGRECPGIVSMAIDAAFVADKCRSFDLRRRNHGSFDR